MLNRLLIALLCLVSATTAHAAPLVPYFASFTGHITGSGTKNGKALFGNDAALDGDATLTFTTVADSSPPQIVHLSNLDIAVVFGAEASLLYGGQTFTIPVIPMKDDGSISGIEVEQGGPIAGFPFITQTVGASRAILPTLGQIDIEAVVTSVFGIEQLPQATNVSGSVKGGTQNIDLSFNFDQTISVNQNLSPLLGTPEPATWAMMAIGFGLVGAALRRQMRTMRATPTLA